MRQENLAKMQLIEYKCWFWKKQFYLFSHGQMEKSYAMMSFPIWAVSSVEEAMKSYKQCKLLKLPLSAAIAASLCSIFLLYMLKLPDPAQSSLNTWRNWYSEPLGFLI